ncbi:serine hydrolase [Chitinophaga hostae]|uniref:Serine hydrolase n=1 Tax=Chitinophaga hostae TaxID=2831022 RepID=A0ABS5J3U5_9BACT|nr:serine hydrolase [Chitinophaga hostae]MBS0029222.1 serine hydrolase [Chitinophaga hostae]
MKKKILSILLSCCTAWLYVPAQTKMATQLDHLLADAIPAEDPGVAVLIAQKGKVVYEAAFGSANLELRTPLTPNMVFRIGSVTKQFTAAGILQLLEQGKISLQDSIQQYLPDFPTKRATITIENLLTHTSGLTDYTSIDSHDPFVERWDLTPGFLVDHFKQTPLEFTPGSRYGYSNSNYVLLARIIEKVTGRSYHDYITEKVIKAAGLTNTRFAAEKNIVPLRVTGYTRDNGFFENCYYQTISLGYGCGDLLSTVGDLYQWNNALLAGKVLQPATLEKAYTPYRLSDGKYSSYGYGWFIDQQEGKKCIHHEGQTSGFIAMEKYFPTEDIYLSILTNVKSGEDKTDFSDKRFALFQQITGLALGTPSFSAIKMSNRLLDSYTGTYQSGKQVITIGNKKGVLFCDASMEGNFKLVPVGTDKFIIQNIKPVVTFEFVKDSAGNVVEFISTQQASFDWLKLVAAADNTVTGPVADPLKHYAGKYQLPSMSNTFITITVNNNKLLFSTTTPLPDAALLPAGPDKFKYRTPGYDFRFEFIRQANGEVQSLRVVQGAVHCPKIR